MAPTSPPETVLVVNPKSGSGDHLEAVRDRAEIRDYAMRTTEEEGHGVDLARAAAVDGADRIVAVGGDGTLNEVVTGVRAADALDRVTVAVVPAGTGNDFATNLGITDMDTAFELLESGDRRSLDIGLADGKPFINSCVAGISAQASAETTPELKSRYGVFAYVLTTIETVGEFSGLEISASLPEDGEDEPVWEGTAAVILVGNGRRFSRSGSEQANLEDGLLDVTIIENASSLELVGERLAERLFNDEGENHERFLASSLELAVEDGTAADFSLDGEFISRESITLETRRGALKMPVGPDYESRPRTDHS